MNTVFLGRYNTSELLTGPEKVAKRIFREVSIGNPAAIFVDYFFKGSRGSTGWTRLFGKEITQSGGSVVRLGSLRIFLLLLAIQPDVVHLITVERFELPILLYRFLLRSRIIVTVHGIVKHERMLSQANDGVYARFKDLFLEWLIMRCADELIFVSETERTLATRYYSFKGAHSHIIPNGIDEAFAESPEKSYDARPLNVFAYERRLFGSAVIDDLVDCFGPVEAGQFALSIVGAKSTNRAVPGHLQVHEVEKMDGGQLRSFLAGMHLYVNHAEYESFSIMAVECMAAGVVPVVADNVGMSYLIRQGINGFVYDRRKPETLSALLEEIASRRFDLQAISRNARSVFTELKWSLIAEAYVNVYRK